jgi:hypothetical protein
MRRRWERRLFCLRLGFPVLQVLVGWQETCTELVDVSFNLTVVKSAHDAHHGSSALAARQVNRQVTPEGAYS